MKRLLLAASLLAFLWGCEKTDECKQLEELMLKHKNLQSQAETYAKQATTMAKRVEKAEEEANVYKKDTGLDRTETGLHKEISSRIEALKGAKVERSVEEVSKGEAVIKETIWRISFKAPSFTKAFVQSQRVAAVPPLLSYRRLSDKGGGNFELELVKPILLEADLTRIATVPLEKLSTGDDIPSQLGFCGASDLRKQIAAAHKRIEEVREDAESVSRLLPLGSSWRGALGRARRVVKTEEANRDILGRYMDMAAKAKLTPSEIGSLGEEVVMAVPAGKKTRGKLDRAADPEFLPAMKYFNDVKAKKLRVIVKNPLLDKRAPNERH